MKSLLGSFVFFVLLTTGVFAQSSASVSGKVTFGGDNSVLHQVLVQIIELRRTVATDDNGSYSFTNVPPGRYTIAAHQDGFSDLARTVTVVAGANAQVDFQLQISGVKETVTVTASGVEESTSQSISSVSVLDSNQIVNRAAVGLGEVTDKEPGVWKRSFGPGNARPVIRGFDGDRVLVATDGFRLGSLASQSGDHAEPVDVFGVERIEIVKGPATLLYGGNAIGGVVNAISGHEEGFHPGFRGNFSVIGSSNSAQAAAGGSLEYGVKNFEFWGNGSGQRTGDYSAGGDYGTVVNSFTRNGTGTFGGGYFGKKAYFTANYNYYQSRYGIPVDLNEEDAETRALRIFRNDEKFNFGYNDANLAITGFKFTIDLSNYRHQEGTLEDGNFGVGTTFRNKLFSYRGIFEQKQYGHWGGRFGFEGFDRKYGTFGDETLINGFVKQDMFSVFGLEELKYDRVSFQFGGRVENNRYRPDDPDLLKRDFTGFSGAAGTRVALWDGGSFFADYRHSYRAPALEELYNYGPHDGTLLFEIGDPNLKAETSDGFDIGVRHRNQRVNAEANFYYYNFKNFVFLFPTGEQDPDEEFPFAEYIQGDSRFWGTELNADITANKYLNIFAGFDYVNAELKNGTPLPRIAPMRGRFGIDAHYKTLSVRPEFVAVGNQDRVFTNETPTAGYGVFNVTGSYIIPGKHFAHVFSVNAFNLGNKLYYNHISFIKDISPEIGRGVRASYTIRFY